MPITPPSCRAPAPAHHAPTLPLGGADRRDFHLTKWYLDVADAQGAVYIGYHASLRWRSLRLDGHHHLWHHADGRVNSHGGLTTQPGPVWETTTRLGWQSAGISGTWDALADGLVEELFSSDEGAISWHCTQPKALAQVHSPEGAVAGWGYTERLEISVPVWQLPFQVLYWGRCHSANHYVVWIKWDGATHQQLTWHNGIRGTDLALSADHALGEDFCVQLLNPMCLRRGVLAASVLKPFARVSRLLPPAAAMAEERKWYSRGRIQTAAGIEPAITIFEEVRW
jgi:hypothetical protein